MLKKLFKTIIYSRHYDKCPRCGETNIDCKNNIWHCYECGHEW